MSKGSRERFLDEIAAEFEDDKHLEKADAVLNKVLLERASREAEVDVRFINRRAAISAGRDQLFVQELVTALGTVFPKGWTAPKHFKVAKKEPVQRILNIVLSDLHFQSLFDPAEVPVPYGAVEESRRLGKVAHQVTSYKRRYRAQTKLMVHLIGDIIENQLHDQREGATLTMQIAAAVEYLTQLLMYWAQEFPQVEVHCTPGNHGRFTSRHKERAVAQKWDAIETVIYFAVRHALKAAGVKNVKFEIGKKPYYSVDLFGAKAFFTHGDTVLRPGTPSKTIDVGGLYHQICRWNAARNIEGPFALFAVGHVHFGSLTNMPGDVVMITNGCLVPPGPFAMSIGAPDVSCGQYMFESTPKHPVGDARFINVSGAEKNAEYNKIIRPFAGF